MLVNVRNRRGRRFPLIIDVSEMDEKSQKRDTESLSGKDGDETVSEQSAFFSAGFSA